MGSQVAFFSGIFVVTRAQCLCFCLHSVWKFARCVAKGCVYVTKPCRSRGVAKTFARDRSTVSSWVGPASCHVATCVCVARAEGPSDAHAAASSLSGPPPDNPTTRTPHTTRLRCRDVGIWRYAVGLASVPERPKGTACKAVQSRVQIPPGAPAREVSSLWDVYIRWTAWREATR